MEKNMQTLPLPPAVRWGRYVAAAGFSLAAVFAVMGLTAVYWADSLSYYHRVTETAPAGGMSGFSVFIMVSYLLVAAIYFFPSLHLRRLARKSRKTDGPKDKKHTGRHHASLKNYLALTAALLVVGGLLLVSGIALTAIGPASFL